MGQRTFWPDAICAGPSNHEAARVGAVYGIPINCTREELTRDGNKYRPGLADLDYIVHACNNCPRLVAALKDVRGRVVAGYGDLPKDRPPGPPTSIINLIDATLNATRQQD
jgi:hypothetical protein